MMTSLSRRLLNSNPLARFRSRSRAFTFVELLIASLIFLVVGIFVAYLTVVAARMSRDGLQTVDRDYNARRAMDIVRRHLMVAQSGSVTITVTGTAPNQTVTVQYSDPTVPDPNNPGHFQTLTSALVVQPTTISIPNDAQKRYYRWLIYKQDVTNTNPSSWIQYKTLRLADMNFTLQNSGTMIQVALTTVGQLSTGAGGKVTGNESSQITLTDKFMFRNATN